MILDPYLDRRSGYRFEVNAHGVRWDALYQNTTSVESNWEGIWQAASQQDGEGWTTEIAIPFKTLSFNPNNDAWGINFERAIQQHDETLGLGVAQPPAESRRRGHGHGLPRVCSKASGSTSCRR